MSPCRRRCVRVLIALVVWAVAGGQSALPAWRGQLEAVGMQFISARALKAMLDRGDVLVLVDARDEEWYQRGHIPGAISIPAEDASLEAVDIERPKRLLYPERLPDNRERLLVFYCGGPT